MPITPNFDFTYPGQYSLDEVYLPTIQTPDITQLFTVRPGIKSGQQIPVVGVLEDIVKAYVSCGDNPAGTVGITNCKIETVEMKVHFQQCKDDFESHFLESWLDDGLAARELSTKLRGIINNLVMDAMKRDNFRILCFGDTTSLSTKYNQLDGLWTQVIADGTAYCYPRIGTALGTGTLAAGAALTRLRAMYEGAPITLKQVPNNMKGFYVTGSVYENLLTSYESNATGSDAQFRMLQKGPNGVLTFRGIPVYPYYAWDAVLADPVAPLYGVTSHLIMYTTSAANIVGVARLSDMTAIRGYFWEENETYNVKGQYKMGYKSCVCELNAVAY